MTAADLVLFSLLGGTALLLYGVRLVGEGLQRAAGTRLRHVLSTLTGNRLKALAVGAGVTAVLQSSSATTVMLVGFASAGLLSLRQTIGVILGADVGTTVTVQLLAFDLLAVSPLIVFVGWLMWTIGRGTLRYVGQAVLGFGFLFLGMKLVSDGTVPLASSALFRDLLAALTGQPLILFLVAAVFTALVRSVSDDEFADMVAELPRDFDPLLPEGPAVEVLSIEAFLQAVGDRAGLDPEAARRATDAVLETLAERIAGGEVADLINELPRELQPALERGNALSHGAARKMSLDEFVDREAEREGVTPDAAREHARAVFATLREALSDKEFSDTVVQLPDDYSALLARP